MQHTDIPKPWHDNYKKYLSQQILQELDDFIFSRKILDPYFKHIDDLARYSGAMQNLHDYCMEDEENKTRYKLSSTDKIKGRIFSELVLKANQCIIYEKFPKNELISQTDKIVVLPFKHELPGEKLVVIFEELVAYFHHDMTKLKLCSNIIKRMLKDIIKDRFLSKHDSIDSYDKILLVIENSIEYKKNFLPLIENSLKGLFSSAEQKKIDPDGMQKTYIRNFFIDNICFDLTQNIWQKYQDKLNMLEYKRKIAVFSAENMLEHIEVHLIPYLDKYEQIFEMLDTQSIPDSGKKIIDSSEYINAEKLFSGLST